jgi:3-hydroxy-3-methylglutaryl CoA synthase
MSGIISYGAYIPFNRIQRSTIAKALETRGAPGERSVASYDEDTATMAVEAARNAFQGEGAKGAIGSLYFATTNPPYQEKLNAATVHAALQLKPSVRGLDVGGSARAGLGSILAAADSAAGGATSLVAISDIRLGAPEGAAEQGGGDGAAAFVVGKDNTIADIAASYSETLEHEGLWRLPGERFAKTWEDRFALTQVYTPLLGNGVKTVLERAGVQPGDLAKIVLDAPNPRAVDGIAKMMGAKPEQLSDQFLESVGHTGPAHAGIMLASALDQAKPGDKILVASVSDGVDAMVLVVTDRITANPNPKPVRMQVDSKRNDLGYTRYLKWREILQSERPRRPDPARPAGPPAFRNRHWKFGFVGSECKACGARQLPPQVVCVACSAQDMQPHSFAEKRAKIVTYTLDRLAYTLQPPMVMAMLDFDEGGRVELEVTDCEPDKVAIGDEVEMTFRRFYTADGVHNYFWKSRPIR